MRSFKTVVDSRGGEGNENGKYVKAERDRRAGLPFFVGCLPEQCLEAVEPGVEYRMVSMVMHFGM